MRHESTAVRTRRTAPKAAAPMNAKDNGNGATRPEQGPAFKGMTLPPHIHALNAAVRFVEAADETAEEFWWPVDEDRRFTQTCPACKGQHELTALPARFCPWCGTRLDWRTALTGGTYSGGDWRNAETAE